LTETRQLLDGVAFLAPELVLLYQSSQAEREKYRAPFEEAYGRMSSAQRQWFRRNPDRLSPEGHPWKRSVL